MGLKTVDEVAGHAGVDVGSSDHHRHVASQVGQEHRRLSGRVAAPDDHGPAAGDLPCLQVGGGVVNAGAFELGQALDVEAAVTGAAGRDHRPAGDGGAVGQIGHQVPGVLPQGDCRTRHAQLGAELLSLDEPSLGEVAARDAGGEAEVVLDPRASAGLAAGRHHFYAEGVQPFGGPIDSRGQPSRPPTHDDHVEISIWKAADGQAQVIGQVPGVARRRTVPDDMTTGSSDGRTPSWRRRSST